MKNRQSSHSVQTLMKSDYHLNDDACLAVSFSVELQCRNSDEPSTCICYTPPESEISHLRHYLQVRWEGNIKMALETHQVLPCAGVASTTGCAKQTQSVTKKRRRSSKYLTMQQHHTDNCIRVIIKTRVQRKAGPMNA